MKKPSTKVDNKPAAVQAAAKEPFDFWHKPAVIIPNKFKYKSLSNWAFNISVGCSHACRFCYVPSAATNRQAARLVAYGVDDPDVEWGEYSLLRPWDEKAFKASLKKADEKRVAQLNPDGNRAIIFCSTTDPFQTFRASTSAKTQLLNKSAKALVTKALEKIRDNSSVNVRILTRSPLAREFFDLFKTFGDRLVFGMSLPTLNNQLARIYEPSAPAPSQRLATLQAAKAAGLYVYVAVAPTYPECDETDLRTTLAAVKGLDPITIFHEPINIRAENVERIAAHAAELGKKLKTEVFATSLAWRRYALDSLMLVQKLADKIGLGDRLHLWPDKSLKSKNYFLKIREIITDRQGLTRHQLQLLKKQDLKDYEKTYLSWLESWWTRISEWPGQPNGRRVAKSTPN